MSAPVTAAELRKEQQAEWGTYVATTPIDIGGARAFNTGDPVPASHVTDGVVSDDQVAKTTTKAGQAAVAAPATPPGPAAVVGSTVLTTEKG